MPMLDLRALLAEAPVRLAPMASYTNGPCRMVAERCGSGFTTNEEIDADALIRDNARTSLLARRFPTRRPVAMQILGGAEESVVAAAERLVDAGADIIDLNMGCPAPKVVRKGKGAALMRDVPQTARLLTALRRAVDVPLTIKIRGGWDERHQNAVEVARMAEAVGVDGITVHPRTRAQRYGGRAPWRVIADVVEAVAIPVTGNGDVRSLAEARRMIAETGCASVMIGRGALGRPWVFDGAHEARSAAERAAHEDAVIAEHLALIDAYLPPREALLQSQKQLALYTAGWREARTLRARIFAEETVAGVRRVFDDGRDAARAREADREAARPVPGVAAGPSSVAGPAAPGR